MVASCCVPLCRSNSKEKDGIKIKLYTIPKDLIRRKQFANAIKRPNWIPSDADRICEVCMGKFKKKMLPRFGTAPYRMFSSDTSK